MPKILKMLSVNRQMSGLTDRPLNILTGTEFIVTRFRHYGVECRDDCHIITSAGLSNNIGAGKNIKWPIS